MYFNQILYVKIRQNMLVAIEEQRIGLWILCCIPVNGLSGAQVDVQARTVVELFKLYITVYSRFNIRGMENFCLNIYCNPIKCVRRKSLNCFYISFSYIYFTIIKILVFTTNTL
jgi:hypothetical protein